MLNKEDKRVKELILSKTNQDDIIKIYQSEKISMDIVNDKEIIEHIGKYVKLVETKGAGHIYIRKKENASDEYLHYINKMIRERKLYI